MATRALILLIGFNRIIKTTIVSGNGCIHFGQVQTGPRQTQGDRPSDAARGPSDDRRLPLERLTQKSPGLGA